VHIRAYKHTCHVGRLAGWLQCQVNRSTWHRPRKQAQQRPQQQTHHNPPSHPTPQHQRAPPCPGPTKAHADGGAPSTQHSLRLSIQHSLAPAPTSDSWASASISAAVMGDRSTITTVTLSRLPRSTAARVSTVAATRAALCSRGIAWGAAGHEFVSTCSSREGRGDAEAAAVK